MLTAVLVKYTFPYNWNWVESLLFGAMFSATDPVAVVAVLKEVRISHKQHLTIAKGILAAQQSCRRGINISKHG